MTNKLKILNSVLLENTFNDNIDEKKERGREEEYFIPLSTIFKFLKADSYFGPCFNA